VCDDSGTGRLSVGTHTHTRKSHTHTSAHLCGAHFTHTCAMHISHTPVRCTFHTHLCDAHLTHTHLCDAHFTHTCAMHISHTPVRCTFYTPVWCTFHTHLCDAHFTQSLQPLQQVLVAGLEQLRCNVWPHIHVAGVDVGHHAVKHIPADVGDLDARGFLEAGTTRVGENKTLGT